MQTDCEQQIITSRFSKSFTISKLYPHFLKILWLIKACSTDSFNRALNFLYVDKEFAVAADGHRLHAVDNDLVNLPQGLWLTVKKTASEIVFVSATEINLKYPDYQGIFPAHGTRDRLEGNLHKCGKREQDVSRLICDVFQYTQNYFNLRYLQDVLSINGHWIIECRNKRDTEPTFFMCDEQCLAAVMPLKFKE